jgi:ABC-2 type transport system ATP-binding protein
VADTNTSPRLEVRGVAHRFGSRHALVDVTLSIGLGVTTLLGPNGAGKTTLMRVVAGQLRLQQGSVVLDGLPHTRPSVARVSYLPQHPQIFGRFTCLEFVTYCAWLRGLGSRRAKLQAGAALEAVGLSDRCADHAKTLSGGMQRRLAIAAVLSSQPRIVLLDEPLAGLDPEQQHEVRRVIRQVGQDASVLVATHVLQDVVTLADKVCLIHRGRVAYDGHVIGFLGTTPQHATTADVERAYVRCVDASRG